MDLIDVLHGFKKGQAENSSTVDDTKAPRQGVLMGHQSGLNRRDIFTFSRRTSNTSPAERQEAATNTGTTKTNRIILALSLYNERPMLRTIILLEQALVKPLHSPRFHLIYFPIDSPCFLKWHLTLPSYACMFPLIFHLSLHYAN